MLSKTTRYALGAVTYLAGQASCGELSKRLISNTVDNLDRLGRVALRIGMRPPSIYTTTRRTTGSALARRHGADR